MYHVSIFIVENRKNCSTVVSLLNESICELPCNNNILAFKSKSRIRK